MRNGYFTKEQIHERIISALVRNPNRLTRAQIRQRIEELSKTKPPKRPKNVVWS